MILSYLENKKAVTLPVDGVLFDDAFDVIVGGVGTGGSVALLRCASLGLKTLGIEPMTSVGGMAAAGEITWHYFGIDGGFYKEQDKKISSLSAVSNSQARKLISEKEAKEKGAKIIYEASIFGVYLEENKVVGVAAITPCGKKNFSCKCLIDGTGDGNICAMAGAEYEFGREIDGKTQPYTMVSVRKKDGEYRATNIDFGRVDQRDDEEFSKTLIFSRAYKNPEEALRGTFMYHSPLLGVREGRRINAEENITLPDIFSEKFTNTPCFYSWADLDKHGWDLAFDGQTLCDFALGANLGAINVTIPISFKSLIPKGIDGLSVGSRALGIDRDLSSAVRMIPDAKKAGEVAADISYLAIKHGCKLSKIPYPELKEMLESTGCLGYDRNKGLWRAGVRDESGKAIEPTQIKWIESESELTDALKTDTPGVAIWSCKRQGLEKFKAVLLKGLASENENLRKHSAFALSVCGSDEGKTEILKMIEQRDGFLLKDSRKNNQKRCFTAIYFSGTLGIREAVPELLKIITDEKEFERDIYQDCGAQTIRYAVKGFNNELFQTVSGSVMALIRLGDRYEDLRKTVSDTFKTAFSDNRLIDKITSKPKESAEYKMTENIKTIALSKLEEWK